MYALVILIGTVLILVTYFIAKASWRRAIDRAAIIAASPFRPRDQALGVTVQQAVKEKIETAVKAAGCTEVVYRSEWLGYLPFGMYHWIECGGSDIQDLPFEFGRDDLTALEQSGFLEKTKEHTNPKDEFDRSTWYRVHLEPDQLHTS